MALPRRDWLQFLFNGGRGIRTTQLTGPYVKSIDEEGNAVVQGDNDAEESVAVAGTGGTATDATARASAATNAGAIVALEAEADNIQDRIEAQKPSLLTTDDKAILGALAEDLNHDLVDSTRILVALKTGGVASNADLSIESYSATASIRTNLATSVILRVPQALVRDPAFTTGRIVYTPSGFTPDDHRDFLQHSGDAQFAYFTLVDNGTLAPVGTETLTAHWEENDLELEIGRRHLAADARVPNVARGAAKLVDSQMVFPGNHGGFTRDAGLDIDQLPDGDVFVRVVEPNGTQHTAYTSKAVLLALDAVATGVSGLLADSVSLSGGTPHGFTGYEVGRLTSSNNLWVAAALTHGGGTFTVTVLSERNWPEYFDRLPPFPAEGSRTGKVAKFMGDTLMWLADATGSGGQSAFAPSKANLYAAVKAIFHPATNAGVTADDTNSELDVAAGGGGADNTARMAAAAAKTVADAALPLAGGTMTGALTLAAAPTADLHASTKKYVDDAAGGADPSLTHRVDLLEGVTYDLHAGAVPTGWANASNDNQGGVAVRSTVYDLASARAATFARTLSSGTGGAYYVVRVPAAANPGQYRIRTTAGTGAYNVGLQYLRALGLSSDSAWRYYASTGPLGPNVSAAALQNTGSAAHLGTTRYTGQVANAGGGSTSAGSVPKRYAMANSTRVILPRANATRNQARTSTFIEVVKLTIPTLQATRPVFYIGASFGLGYIETTNVSADYKWQWRQGSSSAWVDLAPWVLNFYWNSAGRTDNAFFTLEDGLTPTSDLDVTMPTEFRLIMRKTGGISTTTSTTGGNGLSVEGKTAQVMEFPPAQGPKGDKGDKGDPGTGGGSASGGQKAVVAVGPRRARNTVQAWPGTPDVLDLIAAGSSLTPSFISGLDATAKTVALTQGTYMATVFFSAFAASSTATTGRYTSNQRFNVGFRVKNAADEVISDQITNSYYRPISDSGADDAYGHLFRSLIVDVAADGAVKFERFATGSVAGPYIAVTSISIRKVG